MTYALDTNILARSVEDEHPMNATARAAAVLEQIKPETAELLANEAKARGLSIDEYLRNLLPNSGNSEEPKEELTPQEKAKRWREFVEKHSVRVSHFVDDSRESIYTREDEAL